MCVRKSALKTSWRFVGIFFFSSLLLAISIIWSYGFVTFKSASSMKNIFQKFYGSMNVCKQTPPEKLSWFMAHWDLHLERYFDTSPYRDRGQLGNYLFRCEFESVPISDEIFSQISFSATMTRFAIFQIFIEGVEKQQEGYGRGDWL